MTEIEGIAVEVIEPRALVPAAPQTQVILGNAALALMSDAEFETNLAALEVGRKRADQIKRALMAQGTDFGTVPGVTKAFLWKSGAETLDKAFGLVATFTVTRVAGQADDEPPYSFHAHSLMHLGSADGPIVGEGFGTCNPWESRYRYRKAERVCPSCGKPAVIKGSEQYGGGWLCWKKKDGCGTKWPDGDPSIESQAAGQVDNPDPWDLENTIAKMAEKRAHVDGTIRATGTSGLFTQDDDSPAVPQSSGAVPSAPRTPPAAGPSPVAGTSGPWRGPVSKGQAPVDGQARQTPDGPSFGFVVTEPIPGSERGRRVQVLALGPLADALALACADRLPAEATVWGELVMVPWDKQQPDGSMKPMPPYRRVIASRIAAPDFTVPAVSVAPAGARDELDDLAW